jgi:hypothetical protein
MAADFRITQSNLQRLEKPQEHSPSTDAEARDTLVRMAAELTNGQSVKSGYLRLIKEKDEFKLGTSVFGKKAENDQARDVVRSLIKQGYGEHAGVEAELQRYLQTRNQKIGTHSFVKLIKTLESHRPNSSESESSIAHEQLKSSNPKANTKLNGHVIGSSVEISRTLDETRGQVDNLSKLLRQSGQVSLDEQERIGTKAQELTDRAQNLERLDDAPAVVKDQLVALDEEVKKIQSLTGFLKEKSHLQNEIQWKGRHAELKVPTADEMSTLKNEFNRFEKSKGDLSERIRLEHDDAMATAVEQVLSSKIEVLNQLLKKHEALHARVEELLTKNERSAAAKMLLEADHHLTNDDLHKRLSSGAIQQQTKADVFQALLSARLERGDGRNARECLNSVSRLHLAAKNIDKLSAEDKSKLNEAFELGVRWTEALNPQHQQAFFSSLTLAEQLGILSRLTSPELRATLFGLLDFSSLPSMGAKLEVLNADEAIVAWHKTKELDKKVELFKHLNPAVQAQAMRPYLLRKRDGYVSLQENYAQLIKLDEGKGTINPMEERTKVFAKLTVEQQLKLLEPASGAPSNGTRIELIIALDEARKRSVWSHLLTTTEFVEDLIKDDDVKDDELWKLLSNDHTNLLLAMRPNGEDNKALLEKLQEDRPFVYSKVYLALLNSREDAWKLIHWAGNSKNLLKENGQYLKSLEGSASVFRSYVNSLNDQQKESLLVFFNQTLMPNTQEDLVVEDLVDDGFVGKLAGRYQLLSKDQREILGDARKLEELVKPNGFDAAAVKSLFHPVWCRHLAAAFASGNEEAALSPSTAASSDVFRSRANLVFDTSNKTVVIERHRLFANLVQVCKNIKDSGESKAKEGIYISVSPSRNSSDRFGHAMAASLSTEDGKKFLVKLYDPNLTNVWKQFKVSWYTDGEDGEDEEGDENIELSFTSNEGDQTLYFSSEADIDLGIDSLFGGAYCKENPVITLSFQPTTTVSLDPTNELAAWNTAVRFEDFEDTLLSIVKTGRIEVLKPFQEQLQAFSAAQKTHIRLHLKEWYLSEDLHYSRLDRVQRWKPRDRMKAELSLEDYNQLQKLTGLNKNLTLQQAVDSVNKALAQAQPYHIELLGKVQRLLDEMKTDREKVKKELQELVSSLEER